MFGQITDEAKTTDSGPKTQYIVHFVDSIKTVEDLEVYQNGIITNLVEKIVFEDGDSGTHVMMSGENIRWLKNLAMALFLLIDDTVMPAALPSVIFDNLYQKVLKEFDE